MQRIGKYTLVVFFSLALFLFLASASAEVQDGQTSIQSSPNILPSEKPTTTSWENLEALSEGLSAKANSLVPQVVALNDLVASLNSQLEKLQSSLLESETLLAQSLDTRDKEQLAAEQAVKAALNRSLWWQRGVFFLAGGFVGYLVHGWEGSAYGAGIGISSDAILELSITFKLFK